MIAKLEKMPATSCCRSLLWPTEAVKTLGIFKNRSLLIQVFFPRRNCWKNWSSMPPSHSIFKSIWISPRKEMLRTHIFKRETFSASWHCRLYHVGMASYNPWGLWWNQDINRFFKKKKFNLGSRHILVLNGVYIPSDSSDGIVSHRF